MKLKTRMGSNRIAIGSHLVCFKFAKTVYFLRYACGTRKKKKEDEQNRNFQVWFFSNLLKVSGTFGVETALEY